MWGYACETSAQLQHKTKIRWCSQSDERCGSFYMGGVKRLGLYSSERRLIIKDVLEA